MSSTNSSKTTWPRPYNSPKTPKSSRWTENRHCERSEAIQFCGAARIASSRCSAVEKRDQARRIPALAAHGLHLRIELVDQRRSRQMGAVAPRFVEADVEVLAHPVHGKTEIEFAGDHGLVAVLHLPGLRRALGNRRDQLFDIEAGFHGEVQAFGEALNEAGDADLVDHFRQLAGA